MEPTNSGSFGQAIGGGSALARAMQRRGMDISALEQTSPAAPGGSELPPNITQATPQVGQEQPVAAQAVGQATGQNAQFESGEMEIATKALKSVIDTSNAIKKAAIKLQGV